MVELVYHVEMFADGKPLADVKLPDKEFVASCVAVCNKNQWAYIVTNLKTGLVVEYAG